MHTQAMKFFGKVVGDTFDSLTKIASHLTLTLESLSPPRRKTGNNSIILWVILLDNESCNLLPKFDDKAATRSFLFLNESFFMA
jgi:hypothetical protein